MAKKYTEKDLFGGSLFKNQVEDAQALLEVLKMLKDELNKYGKQVKDKLQKVNTESTEGLQQLNTITEELIENTKTLNKLSKQEAIVTNEVAKATKEENKAKKTQADLTDEEIKDKIRLQKINRQRKKDLEAEIILEKESVKTRQDLRERIKALRIEAEKLDITTEEGREQLEAYNSEIDELTNSLKDSSDEFLKNKINIGNYTESVKEALSDTDLFSDATGKLGLILRAVNKVWSISTESVEDDTKAKEQNEKATSKLGKTAQRTGKIIQGSIIGLLVAGVGAITSFFTSSQEGAIEQEKLFARISSAVAVLVDRLSSFGKGLVLFFQNVGNEVDLFKKKLDLSTTINPAKRKEITDEIEKIEEAIKKTGEAQEKAFSGAFAEGFLAQIDQAQQGASELIKLQFQIENIQRQNLTLIEQRRIAEEELVAIYDDDTRSFIERQEASRKLTELIEGQNTALDLQRQLNEDSLKLSREAVIQSLREKGVSEERLSELGQVKDLSQEILDLRNSAEFRGENGGLIVNTEALDNLIEAEKELISTEADLQAFRLDNRAKQRKLLFDEVEQELDFLIDANDQIVQDNQRVVDSERETFENRAEALRRTQVLLSDARQRIFKEVAKTVEELGDQDIAQAFAEAQSEEDLTKVVTNLNARLKELGLAEIPINRLLETFREIKTQERDIKDAQELLFFAGVDAEETRERIQLLRDTDEQLQENKKTLEELLKVDVSQLSDEEFAEFQKKVEDFNKRKEEEEKQRQQDQLQSEIEALEERLKIEQEFVGTKEEDSEKILEIEEELAQKRIDLNQITIDELEKQQEEAIKDEEKRREKANEKAEADAKARAERQKELTQKTFQALENISDAYFEKERERIEEQIDASKEQERQLIEATEGRVQLGEESIAFERQQQAELAREREQLAKRQARTELLLASLSAFQANDGDIGKTVADIIALREFVNAIPLFYEGTEDTGAGGNLDNKGGFHAILHPHERVITAEQNRKIGNISNEELTSLAELYQSGHFLTRSFDMSGGASVDYSEHFEGLKRELRELPRKMPVSKLQYNEIQKVLTEEIRRQGRTERFHHKTNRLFGK